MADLGINFRNTSGYVTDPAGTTYCLPTDSYPTTRGGLTFGWSGGPDGRDRDTGVDPRLAGLNFVNPSSGAYCRVDITNGSIDVYAAFGDAVFDSGVEWILRDGTTTFATITNGGSALTGGTFKDATSVTRSAANWPANNAAVNRTFVNGHLRVQENGGAASFDVVAHIRVADAGGGGGTVLPVFRHHYINQGIA
jgi:hypothetical protein